MSSDLPRRLVSRFQQPLPGWQAQSHFQPELSFGRHRGPVAADARQAAVLVVLYPYESQWHLPLMLRPVHMPQHGGQISLPGGLIEPGENSQQAALREYVEELGAASDDLQVIGQLSPLYLFASNHFITPWVAVSRERPCWNPSQREVERLLEVPLGHLLDRRNIGRIERRQRGLEFRAPCYVWQKERIWGATGMILAELVASVADL